MIRFLFIFTAGLLVFSTLAGILSSYYWFFDLFNHFRLQILLTAIAFVGVSWRFNRKYLTIGGIVCVVNMILFFMPLYFYESVPPIVHSKKSETVKIISANVLHSNKNYQQALDVITAQNPDIIALIEPNAAWIEKFDRLKNIYPYSKARIKQNNFSLAIYSKIPFTQGDLMDIGGYDSTLGLFAFDMFDLILVHPIPPLTSGAFDDNKNYIKIIANTAKNKAKPVIVTGDFNNTLWSEPTKLLHEVGLRRINPYGVSYTWPVKMPLLAVQIDHFFSKGINQADFKILPNIGSDHYPVQAIIKLE